MQTRNPILPFLQNVALFSALGCAAAAQAGDPIVIGTLSQDRSPSCGDISYGFLDGNFFTNVRAALESDANFSPGGIVGRDVVFAPPMSLITNEALQGVDILFVSPSQPALSDCEVAAIGSFLNAGGGVFAFANDAGVELAALVGATDGGIGAGTGQVLRGTAMSAGPFGIVQGDLGWSFHRVFSPLGKSGQACVTSSGAIAASFTRGLGRLIIVNDEEWCGDQTLSGCAASWMPSAPRLTLFLNSVAWVAPAASFAYADPGPTPDIDCDGDVDGFDLALLLNAWGPCSGCRADITRDGQVNGKDLAILLVNWSA
ncbi:MAG: hypothetical protein RLY21_1961 [Planctomycetota bacterium]|jgi:hypothetical protein